MARLYDAGWTHRQLAKKYGVDQKVIYKRMKQRGLKTRPAHRVRGDDGSYKALHRRVIRERGPAQRCTRCGVAGLPIHMYHWANLTGNYEDINDFEEMCAGCHNRFDADRRRATGENTCPIPFLPLKTEQSASEQP